MAATEWVQVPVTHSPEFRRRAVELARHVDENGERLKSVSRVAVGIGISESCLCNGLAQDDVDSGHRDGLTYVNRDELVRLRLENRVLRMEKEILGKAAALFITENGHRPS